MIPYPTFRHLLVLFATLPLAAQDAPVVADHHIIDSSEPALIGLLDTADRFGRDFNPLGDVISTRRTKYWKRKSPD